MGAPLRIGIAGLGTVGAGLVRLIAENGQDIAQRAGRDIAIAAVSARTKSKDRGIDISSFRFEEDPAALARADDIDVVIELIGGDSGPARTLVDHSLQNGKHVVTANKALLAKHGREIAVLAEKNGLSLGFEASVAGGIPIIKALREGFAGNKVQKIAGILNGTCNYILTEMRQTGRDFTDVLSEAQAKGYAEADPTFDVDGIDAAHKLCILTSLGFGVAPDFAAMDIRGIRDVTAEDIRFASELGYRIKLLGLAERQEEAIAQSLEPCLVPQNSALGNVEGVFNAVSVEGDFIGHSMLEGRGAGAGPTASAVMSDIVDIARGRIPPVFGVPAKNLISAQWAAPERINSGHYIRLTVRDEPGVIADVSLILKNHCISIESMIQRGRRPGQPVSIVLTTHECSRASIRKAQEDIASLKCVLAPPMTLRMIEDLS